MDHFVFTAKKGRAIRFEVKARRFGTLLRSSLDSMLEILNAKGVVVAQNDDANGKDSALSSRRRPTAITCSASAT